jgi:XRE family aerobic/anaerobic benzoate catabolism transcriptional regulator
MHLNRDALRVIRERSGLNKAALARQTGVDASLISRLESGERTVTPAVAKKLADGLGVPITDLIAEEAA